MSHKRRSSDAAAVEMSHKRRGHDDDPNQQRAGGKRQSRRRKHYLYLVLDDWEKGFSIHKIDADTFDSNNSDDSDDEEELGEMIHHLPEHPALRLEQPVYVLYPQTNDTTDDMSSARRRMLPRLQTDMAFAAMGTKIFALMNQRCGLVYDAETAVMSVGAHAPARMACGSGIFLAAGDVLYALMYSPKLDKQHPHSFQAMSLAPTAQDDDDARRRHHPTQGWTWNTLPPPPFASYVHSYALHPDGHTIFMTSANDKGRMGTYSFDTNVDDPAAAWRYHGNWVLPFQGKGHYDSDLDAWVGLHRDGGYVCCCRPVSPSFQSTAPCFYVDCKTAKEKMFSKRHIIRVSLTYMGASKFCLVECVAAKKMDKGQTIYGPHDGCIIHLTIFGLKYNHTGELQITEDRSARSFLVSRHRDHFAPAAFWM